jgi:hypothetical protein
MLGSGGTRELAQSLAAVAIAALGGPLPAGQVALAQVVKHAQVWLTRDAETRELRQQVAVQIQYWAGSEHLDPEAVRLGLAVAVELAAEYGLDAEQIADLDFDPDAVAKHVMDAAHARDRYWGTESHYGVAERAIEVMYRELVSRFQFSQEAVLPAVRATRHEFIARLDSLVVSSSVTKAAVAESRIILDQLAEALLAAGSAADVMTYLEGRIEDWDVSVWASSPTRSAVERPLRVRAYGSTDRQGAPASAPTPRGPLVLESVPRKGLLVVLGGPGSGKTWLAGRLARDAAKAALSALEQGAGLNEVELPLLTTWDQWTKSPGRARESLVNASFASGSGHAEPDSASKVVRTFNEPGRRVLLVLDSLDEAADLVGQPNRLHELRSLRGWRAVVTSRPAAWDATYRGDASRDEDLDVVELLDLDDPETFIAAWFVDDPAIGQRLIQELRGTPRADLARVPLLLTFYCLIAEDRTADGRLPTFRRDLYQRLVRRLLQGGWAPNAPGPDAGPDEAASTDLLTTWAWEAVRHRVTPVGLGDWGDSFAPPNPPPRRDRRAIDHVAPKVAVDAEGHVTRRFVHRTVLEHFVAEHVATLRTDEAVKALLPHLWFDPDWEFAAPAAIAAHNRRRPGKLLPRILDRVRVTSADPARQFADSQIDLLLLRVAEESDPDDWPRRQRELLHANRIRNAVARSSSVARSVHWADSNDRVRTELGNELITLLATSEDTAAVPDLAAALSAVDPADNELETIRNHIVGAVGGSDSRTVGHLIDALAVLEPTGDDQAAAAKAVLHELLIASRETGYVPVTYFVKAIRDLNPPAATLSESRDRVLEVLPTAWDRDPRSVEPLVAALTDWSKTQANRDGTRQALLAMIPMALRRENPWPVRNVIAAVGELSVSDEERLTLRRALLGAVPGALHSKAPWVVEDLLAPLTSSDMQPDEQQEIRLVLLTELPHAIRGPAPGSVASLAALLPFLASTSEQRSAVRQSLLSLLPETLDCQNPGIAAHLAEAVSALQPTPPERTQTIDVLLRVLRMDQTHLGGDIPAAGLLADYLPRIVDALAELGPMAVERAEARHAVTAVLADIDPQLVDGLVRNLGRLVATPEERDELVTALLVTLSDFDPWATPKLVQNIISLDSTAAPAARAALLIALSRTYPGDVRYLLTPLLELQPTLGDIATARGILIASLAQADRYGVLGVVEALPSVQPTATEEGIARNAIVQALQGSDHSFEQYLVAALPPLNPSASDRRAARAVIFEALRNADESDVADLLEQLFSLAPSGAERANVRTRLLEVVVENPDLVGEIATHLPALTATKADREQIRTAFLQAIPRASAWALVNLVEGLRHVSRPSKWLTWLTEPE